MRRLVVIAAVLGCGATPAPAEPPPRASKPARDFEPSPKSPPAKPPPTADTPEPAPLPPAPSSPVPAAALRWIAAASGSTPEMNQVQIEQDIALAAEVLGEGGRVLFGAGVHAPIVQVLDAAPPTEDEQLLRTLGDLFAPRGGRDAHYRRPEVAASSPATADTVLDTLREAVAQPGDPLLVYIAGHGDMAEGPRGNRVTLWGQTEITVAALGAVLDDAQRPVRFVATTCFSGGFGELAFHQTDVTRGAARTDRCGLFAAPWDLEASGCDPNPDRASQQGYGLHFLNALRKRDRDGRAVPLRELDLDDDGAVSLLEAHTRVRLFSEAADVPTTTSERWLRQAAPRSGRMTAVELPEEDRVIEVLSLRLGMTKPGRALAELERLDDELEALQRTATQVAHAEELAYRAAASSLLAKWPVLDDAWHPDFAQTLREHGAAIRSHLAESETYAAYTRARADSDRAQQAVWDKRVAAAPVERLVRALDNRAMAGRLKAEGGPAWTHYAALLACERATLQR